MPISSFVQVRGTAASAAVSTLCTGLVEYLPMNETSAGGAPVRRVGLHQGFKFTDATNVPSGTGLVYPACAEFTQADGDYFWRNDYRLQFEGLQSWTLAAWVRRLESDVTGYRGIVDDTGGAALGYMLFITNDSTLVSNVYDADGVSQLHNSGAGGTALVTNTWHLVRMWYDAATGFHYNQKDLGAIASDAIDVAGLLRGDLKVQIGTLSGGSFWGGNIGPLMWWDRVLTDAEWLELYNGGAGRVYTCTPPVAAWKPSDLGNCQLWLAADDMNGNGDLDTDWTDTDLVATWHDLSGNDRDMLQAVAGNKPAFRWSNAGPFDKPYLPGVTFNGSDEWLAISANLFSGHTGTIFAVIHTNPALGNYGGVFSASQSGVANRFFVVGHNYDASRMYALQQDGAGEDQVKGSSAVAVNTAYLMMWQSDGTQYIFRKDGADETEAVVSGANSGDWISDVTGVDRITVGWANNTTGYYLHNGYLGELVVYDTALSAPNIALVEAYLAAKWGITI